MELFPDKVTARYIKTGGQARADLAKNIEEVKRFYSNRNLGNTGRASADPSDNVIKDGQFGGGEVVWEIPKRDLPRRRKELPGRVEPGYPGDIPYTPPKPPGKKSKVESLAEDVIPPDIGDDPMHSLARLSRAYGVPQKLLAPIYDDVYNAVSQTTGDYASRRAAVIDYMADINPRDGLQNHYGIPTDKKDLIPLPEDVGQQWSGEIGEGPLDWDVHDIIDDIIDQYLPPPKSRPPLPEGPDTPAFHRRAAGPGRSEQFRTRLRDFFSGKSSMIAGDVLPVLTNIRKAVIKAENDIRNMTDSTITSHLSEDDLPLQVLGEDIDAAIPGFKAPIHPPTRSRLEMKETTEIVGGYVEIDDV